MANKFLEAISFFEKLSEKISTITFNLNFSGLHHINKYFEYNYVEQALKKGNFFVVVVVDYIKFQFLKL